MHHRILASLMGLACVAGASSSEGASWTVVDEAPAGGTVLDFDDTRILFHDAAMIVGIRARTTGVVTTYGPLVVHPDAAVGRHIAAVFTGAVTGDSSEGELVPVPRSGPLDPAEPRVQALAVGIVQDGAGNVRLTRPGKGPIVPCTERWQPGPG